ncbi:MAG: cysteine--tRNA ligase, partial [Candidatus Omnitrophica bacterium]|nr:cysteine--tRNA ligase [Candidatus Omnitrophota bacterium]
GTESFEDEFRIAMDDDFNMPKGLAVLFGIVNVCNEKFNSDDEHKDSMLAYARDIIQKILDVFLLTFETKEVFGMSSEEIETKINIRLQCKKEKNYQGADKIRKKLEEKGVILEDTKDGTQWRKKI